MTLHKVKPYQCACGRQYTVSNAWLMAYGALVWAALIVGIAIGIAAINLLSGCVLDSEPIHRPVDSTTYVFPAPDASSGRPAPRTWDVDGGEL